VTSSVVVVSNPTAGKGRAAGAGQVVVRRLQDAGHDVVDATGSTAEQARGSAAEAVRAGADAVVVVGGDGMVHLGVGICADTGIPLGIVATGTGNDIARGLGLPVGNVASAVKHVVRSLEPGAPRRAVDAVLVETASSTSWYVGVLSAGFDAVVNERANGWAWPRGRMRYNLAIARELPVFRALRYRLVVDGVREELSAMLVAVANGPSFGGGMRIAPHASFDDGLLDLLVLRPISVVELVRVFPRVFAGTHVTHPQVSVRRVRSVEVETLDLPVVAYADGERLRALPVRCEVVPGAVTVLGSPGSAAG
jgi:diacylglycerol kinase (ATP)